MSYNRRFNRGGPPAAFNSTARGNVLVGVDAPICKITIPSLSADDAMEVTISDAEAVASYSWANRSQPTILVPGMNHSMHRVTNDFNNLGIRLSASLEG